MDNIRDMLVPLKKSWSWWQDLSATQKSGNLKKRKLDILEPKEQQTALLAP